MGCPNLLGPDFKKDIQVYNEQVAPLVEQIIAICKENNLPALIAVQMGDSAISIACDLDIEKATDNILGARYYLEYGTLPEPVIQRIAFKTIMERMGDAPAGTTAIRDWLRP